MGEDGWMGVGWPKEYGGHGLGEIEQTIFANEAQYADVHLPAVTLQTVGPTLIKYGSEKQKDLFLKRILAGDVHFAIGYSEPDAGTDLASLRTSARRDGDHYVVNGQKLWTTGGHQADYVWLAVRTDPDAPKHKGISILIVDTTDPGYSHTPIITADGSHHVNATYYNDVRVPVDMLVGEENQGWKLITTQLNHERVMLGPAGRIEGLRDRVIEWATKAGVVDRPDVVELLGQVTAVFRVNELLNWEVARAAAVGEISVGDASSSKVFAADQVQHLLDELTRVVHRYGDPSDEETRTLMDVPRRPEEAEPGPHVRRRRPGGAARADRDVRPRPAAGAPLMGDKHERIMAEAERIKALGECVGVGRAVPGQPGHDRHLAGRHGLRQRAVPPGRGAAVDGPGVDDARAGPEAPARGPAEPDDRVPHRRGLHRRARHQLRAELRALPPGRRGGPRSPARSTRSPGRRTPPWARATS